MPLSRQHCHHHRHPHSHRTLRRLPRDGRWDSTCSARERRVDDDEADDEADADADADADSHAGRPAGGQSSVEDTQSVVADIVADTQSVVVAHIRLVVTNRYHTAQHLGQWADGTHTMG